MNFEPGDLLFFYGEDLASRIIEWATRGPSHVGIVSDHDDFSAVLYESTTLANEPDLLTDRNISGVQAHLPMTRVREYPGQVYRCRLTKGWRLSPGERWFLRDWLQQFHGEPYDLRGALLSGTRLFKWTAMMPYPDLESLFCSELCAAALMRIAFLPSDNPTRFTPASLLRTVRRRGLYSAPELIPVES